MPSTLQLLTGIRDKLSSVIAISPTSSVKAFFDNAGEQPVTPSSRWVATNYVAMYNDGTDDQYYTVTIFRDLGHLAGGDPFTVHNWKTEAPGTRVVFLHGDDQYTLLTIPSGVLTALHLTTYNGIQ